LETLLEEVKVNPSRAVSISLKRKKTQKGGPGV